jgi:hypothetical protein
LRGQKKLTKIRARRTGKIARETRATGKELFSFFLPAALASQRSCRHVSWRSLFVFLSSTKLRRGLLFNFNIPILKDGIKRFAL